MNDPPAVILIMSHSRLYTFLLLLLLFGLVTCAVSSFYLCSFVIPFIVFTYVYPVVITLGVLLFISIFQHL